MGRYVKILLLFICLFPFKFVLAEACSGADIDNLKKLADTIQIDSEFNREVVSSGIYDSYIVTVSGLTEDLYVMSEDESIGFFYWNIVDGSVIKKVGANTDVFQVYSMTCSNVVLRTVDLKLKRYNQYSEREECEGIDDLDVCGEFYDGFISYDEFMKEIEKYHNKKGSVSSDKVNDYIEKYSYLIIVGVAIVAIVVILLLVRNHKRNRLD